MSDEGGRGKRPSFHWKGVGTNTASFTFDEVVKKADAWGRMQTSGNLGLFWSREQSHVHLCVYHCPFFFFPLRHSDHNINQLPLQLENGLSCPHTHANAHIFVAALQRIKSSFPVPLQACQLASRLCVQTNDFLNHWWGQALLVHRRTAAEH